MNRNSARTERLLTGEPLPSLLLFSLPIICGNIFQQLYNIVDAVVVGRLLGSLSLAGISVASPLMDVLYALILGGCKMQELEGEYFYIFRWHDGSITDWNSITPEQCRLAGNIQGRIHAVQPARETGKQPELRSVDWARYIRQTENRHSALTDLLRENLPLLNEAQEKLNRARLALPDLECITDEDMDPKNVMWMNGRPAVIDLECLDYGNPVSHVLQLSLQWAGITICSLDPNKQRAFLEGWLETYDPGFRDFAGILGLAYTWIEWLEFNIRRALGQCRDEKERALGEQEVRNTVNRIRYLREMEHAIRQQLDGMF